MRIKLLICDQDGTLISFGKDYGSSWEALSIICGVHDEYKELLNQFYDKKDKEGKWAETTARMFKGMRIEDIPRAIPSIPYCRGVKEFFSKKRNFETGIISSGIDIIAERVARELNFDFFECCKLERKERVLTGKLVKRIPLWNKEKVLKRVVKERGLDLEQVCYIWDNDNDLECIKSASIGILYEGGNHINHPEYLREYADYTIHDFKELEKILM